jgi:Arc/MetJ-type ribon-helix-helix transcriptional regulator
MQGKVRLSATIDATLLSAAEAAVRRGDVASVSAWVNNAMELQLTHEKRLAALDEFLAAFEQEFGEITEAEIEDAAPAPAPS